MGVKQRMFVCQYPTVGDAFSNCIKNFWKENRDFSKSLLRGKLDLDDAVTKRLKDLGYID
jgi:hypothetical protein